MAVSEFLRDVIAELKAAGAVKARVEFDGAHLKALEVDFGTAAVAPAGFVGADGKPVDLDEGAGPLTRDPDDQPAPVLETSDAGIERANFRKPKAA